MNDAEFYDLEKETQDRAAAHLGAVAVAMLATAETQVLGEALAQASLNYTGNFEWNYKPGEKIPVEAYVSVTGVHYARLRNLKESKDPIYWALFDLALADGYSLQGLRYVPAPAPKDWRQQILAAIEHGGPVNQAVVAPLPEVFPHADRMRFRDTAELLVYQAFKRRQESSKDAALLIAPNAAVRLPERTWEVDFLVAQSGRAGVLEIDGATHRGRRAADASRDRLLQDAGIAHVERVPVEDARDDLGADQVVHGFLRRLMR